METGDSENVIGERGHGLSLYVSRVSLHRDIDINTSCILVCVVSRMHLYLCANYSDLLH